jgi:hypothetical protein
MKKYLFGLFAIALAIGFSAFTVASKKSPLVKFEFHGDNETQFQTSGQWELDATPEIECDEFASQKTACILEVDQAIATTVTNESTLVSYLASLSIDTYSEIDNAVAQGIDVVQPKERVAP